MKKNRESFADRFSLVVDEDFEDLNEYEIEETEEELQRTVNWRLQRNGCWTASMCKKLMTCNSRGGKMDWNNPSKALEFGAGVIKVVYAVAMSRKRGYYIETDIGLPAKYGTAVEPLIFELSKKHFAKQKLTTHKVGFVTIENYPKAGASSDYAVKNVYEEVIYNGEIKACTSWETHYDRTFDYLDEDGTDFWQVQFQMTAHKSKSTIYIVSEPPSDIKKYVYSENIMDLLSDFEKECRLSFEEVKASTVHQKALLTRIDIVEKVVQRWLEEEGNLRDIFYEEIDLKKSELKEEVVFISETKMNNSLKEDSSDFPEFPTSTPYPYSEDLEIKKELEKIPEKIDLKDLPEDFPF